MSSGFVISIAMKLLFNYIQYTSHQNVGKKLDLVVNLHYESVLIKQCFRAWKVSCTVRVIEVAMVMLLNLKVYILKVHIFQLRLGAAVSHYNVTLCSQVLHSWKAYVSEIIRFKQLLLKSMYFSWDQTMRKVSEIGSVLHEHVCMIWRYNDYVYYR